MKPPVGGNASVTMAGATLDPQKMPPSSVHQANIGIPGGFNVRGGNQNNLPRLPNPPRDINNPSYPGQHSANNLHSQGLNTATAISQSGPPPMPPVSNNTFKIDSNNQVVSSPATYPTSTQVQVKILCVK